jgi:hypothetical protein
MTTAIRTRAATVIATKTAAKNRNLRKRGAKSFAPRVPARPATTGVGLQWLDAAFKIARPWSAVNLKIPIKHPMPMSSRRPKITASKLKPIVNAMSPHLSTHFNDGTQPQSQAGRNGKSRRSGIRDLSGSEKARCACNIGSSGDTAGWMRRISRRPS